MAADAFRLSVVDRLDIIELYSRQSHLIDSGDSHGWAATFTHDGSFSSPTYKLTARGTSELQDFAQSSNGAALKRGEQFRHHVSEIVITSTGADSADSSAYLMITATSSEGTRIDRSVVLHDRLVRDDGRWLFKSRETFRD